MNGMERISVRAKQSSYDSINLAAKVLRKPGNLLRDLTVTLNGLNLPSGFLSALRDEKNKLTRLSVREDG